MTRVWISETVSYDYNLAGQLKRITDPFNATINYNHDTSGRVASITGTSFSGVTTYTTNMQYRAWGALKHVNYGNSRTLDASYSSRMQMTSFGIPNVLNKTYQYYSDGELRYSHDLVDDRFDRSYSYDYASRMTDAFSGPQARGEADSENRPYNQSYTHDAFNHLTSQTGKHWSSSSILSSSTTFTNNRRDFSSYDADGNLLSGTFPDSYTYNSAGEMNAVQAFNDNASQVFDGDGRRIKTAEATQSSGQWSTQVTYYITSSVLGGRVLTEMTESDGKQRTFVYAGDRVLAWQTIVLGTEHVKWEHRDPSNASFRTTNENGSLNDQTYVGEGAPAELDPLGTNADLIDPYLFPPPPEENLDSLLSYPSFGGASTFGTSYT
jgi:YD repeat-containing protein